MNETLTLVLAWLAGGLIGAMFFGGLWWTVQRGVSSPHPALWFMGSLMVRMGLALAGFYYIGRGHWKRLLWCLLGFVVARLIVMWLTRSMGKPKTSPAREASHAP